MDDTDNKKTDGPAYGKSRPIENFRDLSIRILHYANLGFSRIGFLRQISKILLDFTGCDGIDMHVTDGDLYYLSEAEGKPARSFNYQILDKNRYSKIVDSLEPRARSFTILCHDIMLGKTGGNSPLLSRNGSLKINDTGNRTTLETDPEISAYKIHAYLKNIARSILIIPFVINDHNNGILILKSGNRFFFTDQEVSLYENIALNIGVAVAARRTRAECAERVKELTCLYGISRLEQRSDLSTEEMLHRIAELLPPAWQYPEVASARISLDGKLFSSRETGPTVQSQTSRIVIDNKDRGFVEVSYSKEQPEIFEGPFLKEERDLIDAVSEEIAQIIEKRESEDAQNRLQVQLRHADRLATIGQLAAGVAHELNEPIGAILGFAQLAVKVPDIPEQVKGDLEKIINSSIHAREVVKKLLFFSRQMPTLKTQVDINRIIRDGLYFLESRMAKEKINLVHELHGNLPEIYADPAQIHQVLVNLVVNAIQSMPEGGTLTLRTEVSDGNIVLIVKDTGEGMEPDVQRQIFVPFFTTKDIGQGTGLGLPVVHGIVSSHGGSIDVRSEIGKGSTFTVTLPISESAESEKDKGDELIEKR